MRNIATSILACLSIFCACCGVPETGVPYETALMRAKCISDLKYTLHFDIPRNSSYPVPAEESLTFSLSRRKSIPLDMLGFEISSLKVNGSPCAFDVVNEHVILPGHLLKKGENSVKISFAAGEQSLNRRADFLYTLLVPDRARTLFPCFDQPDLKARYTLSLTVPNGWTAVSNTDIISDANGSDGRHLLKFRETEPLSTYLFSFVAGEFERVSDGAISLYHRENDPSKVVQCGEVLRLIHESVDWMEEYTGVPYPFAKYDCIILPDFQYGGMEHTGATLYNDRRIFLGEAPTTDELLQRASLIAHETAHMWFGDLVTMKWFNDVWTKEVFANFFAAKMVRPLFPDINHSLSDLKSYYASAYEEDRTLGSNAIQRPLDNLSKAGLIYCNIIYDKSPVVMEMLEKRMGEEIFRDGIRKYLSAYAYSNASWDDLVDIWAPLVDFDIEQWSRVWVKEKGMPVFSTFVSDGELVVCQEDPFGDGNVWQENVAYTLVCPDGRMSEVAVVFDEAAEVRVPLPSGSAGTKWVDGKGDVWSREDGANGITCVIPNSDGAAYGFFKTDSLMAANLYALYRSLDNENTRMSLLMTLYENALRGQISLPGFIFWTSSELPFEKNSLIQSSMLGYAVDAAIRAGGSHELENTLYSIASDCSFNQEFRLMAFRRLLPICDSTSPVILSLFLNKSCETSQFCSDLNNTSSSGLTFTSSTDLTRGSLTLSESDYTTMAYQLMLRYPAQSSAIRDIQASRITNHDRLEAFLYISQACSANRSERDAFFQTLLSSQTRGPESRVTAALSLLTHPIRGQEALERILPALNALEEVQRTGDIFFPTTWCDALLSTQTSPEASVIVRSFIEAHRETMDPLLLTKVLQHQL